METLSQPRYGRWTVGERYSASQLWEELSGGRRYVLLLVLQSRLVLVGRSTPVIEQGNKNKLFVALINRTKLSYQVC